MTERRIAFELAGEPGVREMIALAQKAEALGCESVWVTETRFTRDAVTTAAAIAASTERILVGTAVTNPFTRGAALTGVTVATLDELASGRFIFGIGPGSPSILERQGMPFEQPLTRLREYVEISRRMLSGDEVTYTGKTVQLRNVQLDFTPVRAHVPMYLGVTGPKALSLAGEIADGVILNGFVSLDYTRKAVEIVRASEQAHGRPDGGIDIAASLAISVDADGARARDAIRPTIAIYLAQFPSIASVSTVSSSDIASIQMAFKQRDPAAAATIVTDEMVAALACAGTLPEVLAAVEARREAGVGLPMLSVLHGDAARLLGQAMSSR